MDQQTTHDALEDPRNADIKIYINSELHLRDDAKVSVCDSGFMLGDGMWEGLRLYDGVTRQKVIDLRRADSVPVF